MMRGRLKRAGPLTVIAAILVLSAALRLVGVSSEALALNASDDAPQPSRAMAVPPAGELDAMLDSFRAREERIAQEEARIEQRLKDLREAEKAVQAQIAELELSESRLRALLAIASTAAEDDVARLTSVYENMKAKDAAIVFEQMQPAFAAGFLARMRPDAAAKILAGVSPQAAYAISVTLAGRHSEDGQKPQGR